MEVLAPAKINLSLRILKRRDDGFHEIETFIAPISLHDEIKIERSREGVDFQCDNQSVPCGDDNLVVRAAKTFFETTKLKGGVSIKLRKKIPQGAGLGREQRRRRDVARAQSAFRNQFAARSAGRARIDNRIGHSVFYF